MILCRVRKFLIAAVLLAVAPLMARAEEAAQGVKTAPPASPTPAVVSSSSGACGGTMTVKVCEMVPVVKDVTRTVYKPVTKEVMVTEYTTQMVQEVKTKTYTEYKRVTETVMKPVTKTIKVPVTECRTEMHSRWKLESYTTYKTKTVDKGHYECREVPAGPGLFDRLCSKKCDPCNPCGSCNTCPKMKTVKCWVPCCVTECVPVCKKKLVKECYPVTKQVCTYKCQTVTEMVPCCVTKCIPECKTCSYTVCKKVCVPHQVKKCVTTCEPVCETVKVTVCEPRWVDKQVACSSPCSTSCDPCASACCGSAGFFAKLKGKFGSKGCHTATPCCN